MNIFDTMDELYQMVEVLLPGFERTEIYNFCDPTYGYYETLIELISEDEDKEKAALYMKLLQRTSSTAGLLLGLTIHCDADAQDCADAWAKRRNKKTA